MQTSRKKVLAAFGTRPEIIKLAPIFKELDAQGLREAVLIVNTNQQKDLLQSQLDFWDIKPDVNFQIDRTNNNLTLLLTQSLVQLQKLIDEFPDLEYIMIQGDTNTALACSQIAFFNKKKLLHIEAGLRTSKLYDPFPEEFNRLVASIVAHHHFAPTEKNKENLLKMGIDSNSISVVGNSIVDALYHVKNRVGNIENSSKHKVVITIHRREKSSDDYKKLAKTIRKIKEQQPHLSFTWVSHPNNLELVRKITREFNEIEVIDHLEYMNFFKLCYSSCLIITDSGGVTEEAVQLGIPVVVYRKNTERIEPIDTEYPFLVSENEQEIIAFSNKNSCKPFEAGNFYDGGNTSKKIAKWIKNELSTSFFDTVVVGGGPAGTGIFMKSIKDGNLEQLLSKGICLIEASDHLVVGNLPNYKVNSDTFSNVFLECLEGEAAKSFDSRELKEGIKIFENYQDTSIPLAKTDLLLKQLGVQLKSLINKHDSSKTIMNSKVVEVKQNEDDTFRITTSNNEVLQAKNIIIASGGNPRSNSRSTINGYANKWVHSDLVIKGNANQSMNTLQPGDKIVIIGGSHSAFSVAHYLLNDHESLISEKQPIEIWAKEVPKVYFPTPEEAINHNYHAYTEEDVCLKTNRVFRLAGLRMDGRQLYMDMLGLGNRPKEKRVQLKLIQESNEIPNQILNDATLIVDATGYTFNMPKFYDKSNQLISFKGEVTLHWVDQQCRLLVNDGTPINNAYAIGLATGFIPSGDLGGESSFYGQTNGLWYYQNLIADIILNQL